MIKLSNTVANILSVKQNSNVNIISGNRRAEIINKINGSVKATDINIGSTITILKNKSNQWESK